MTLRLGHCIAAAAFTACLTLAGQAAAHAHLISSTPAAGATVAATSVVRLEFSEALEPKFSAASITLNAGKAVAAASVVQAKQVLLTAAAPLAAGGYKLSWHVVSRDGHRTKGEFSFTVR